MGQCVWRRRIKNGEKSGAVNFEQPNERRLVLLVLVVCLILSEPIL